MKTIKTGDLVHVVWFGIVLATAFTAKSAHKMAAWRLAQIRKMGVEEARDYVLGMTTNIEDLECVRCEVRESIPCALGKIRR